MIAALLWLAATTVSIAPTATANGTTLPFQRHVIRLGPAASGAGILVAALQEQRAEGEGLTLHVSTDGGRSWRQDSEVPVDPEVRFTADLLPDPDGRGFLLLYGVEPHSSRWTHDRRFHVGLFHYVLGDDGAIFIDRGPVTIFSPGEDEGWFRPALTRDALGTLHVTATRYDDRGYGFYERRSIDEGAEWTPEEELARSRSSFLGGRVSAFGSQVAVLYDEYDPDDHGRYRLAAAGPCAPWSEEERIGDDGLYHSGAFATVATPDGRLHLAYHEKATGSMRHRVFDGASWSEPFVLDPVDWWSNQPALARHGNDVIVAWNHMVTEGHMEIRARTRRADGTWEDERLVDGSGVYKGYTTGSENVLPGESMLVLWCEDVDEGGSVVRLAPVEP